MFPDWNPEGEFLVSGGNDGRIVLSSIESDNCIPFNHNDKVNWLGASQYLPVVVFVADQTSVVTLRSLQ